MARLVTALVSAFPRPLFPNCVRMGLFAFVSLLLPSTVLAQDVQDPTRPPVLAQDTVSGEPVMTGPVLQSVLISPSRKIAMIDGVAIRLGSKVGVYTLVKVTETEVVLRQGRHVQILKLHPDFEKKPVQTNRKSNSSAARP
ncbi:MAG: hypothetical protein HY253_10810 [Burkholderiales bacterium]|nr:hypothetical protein [Burkholderiales bacterium]